MAFRHQFWNNLSATRWSKIMWKMSLSGLFILFCVCHVRPRKVVVTCKVSDGGYELFSSDADLDHLNFTAIITGEILGITHNHNTQDIYFTKVNDGIYKCDCDVDTMLCPRIIHIPRWLRGIAVYNDMLYYVDHSDDKIYKTTEAGQKEIIYTNQTDLHGMDLDRRDGMIYFIDFSNNKLMSMNVEGQSVKDVLFSMGPLRNVEIDQTARDLYIGTVDWNNAKIIRLNLDTREQTIVYNQGSRIWDIAILDQWIIYLEQYNGLKVVDMSGTPHSPVNVAGFERCTSYLSIHVIENTACLGEFSTTYHASTSEVKFITTTPRQVETTDSPSTVTTNPGDHTNVGSLSADSSNTSVTANITTNDRSMTTEEITEDHSTVKDMFSTEWALNEEHFPHGHEEDLPSAFETFASVFPVSLEIGVRVEVIVNSTQIEIIKYKLKPIEGEFLGDSNYKHPLTVRLTAAFVNARNNNSGYVTIAALKTPTRITDYQDDDMEQTIASPLLSINFFNETGNLLKHENKQHPFKVTFPIPQLNKTDTLIQPRRVCSFWNNEKKLWSQDGSITFDELSTTPYQICGYTHLTTFAVLFDYSKDDNREYSPIAEIVSIIGSIMSVLGLCIGLGIFARLWRRPPIDKEKMIIHSQLMIVMVIAYVLNMVSKSAKSQTACLVIAIFRYNMFLNMFSIMFIEAVHLFRMIVIVFGGQRNFRAIYAAISFGVPMLLTIITASIGQDQLHDKQSCWLAKKYIWNFIAPVATLLTANVLILASVVRQTLMVAAQDRIQSARIGLRSTLLLIPMLGISWLVGFLANLSLVTTYMFDIIISLQGIYLVVVIFVINSEVRNATLEWFRAKIAAPRLNNGMNLRRVQVQPAPPDATIDATD